jgi:hypothetical protein
MNKNIAIIVIDALRYDAAMMANTPNFKKLFGGKTWYKCFANGTYTLPSQIAMFKSGHLPTNNFEAVPPYYTRKGVDRIFNVSLNWTRNRNTLFPIPPAPNIVKGFEKLGYISFGIGGVHWFNTNFETSAFWKGEYFDNFYWSPSFAEDSYNGFELQIELTRGLLTNLQQPLFYFIDIASTHAPCRGNNSLVGQAKALEYIDSHVMEIVDLLPRPCFTIIMSDHGTCFGENGLSGHGFYHPKIMEVPMFIVELA